ncbi:MAG TPA: class IV adenylate cyclase [Sphaerochaeta sp.]|nr:MAG: class IV adenylate cyclase [Spirochaetae bacterium HGW-Spirochaetae-4]HCJ93769.1 class IV adenylate cyclase [Sphaerochaeta sp.]
MAREIECKVSLEYSEIAEMVRRIGLVLPDAIRSSISKDDIYYTRQSEHKALFRLRREEDGITVTRKEKEERNDGVEVNHEIEFSCQVEDFHGLGQFFASLAYVPLIEKRKHGTAWVHGTLTVELVEVDGLGWFLEMERLLPDDASDTAVEQALLGLAELREQLDIAAYPLESRYYIDMLQALGT